MNSKRSRPSKRARQSEAQDWTLAGIGLDPSRYAEALAYLFDRPLPKGQQQAWYWDDERTEFDASALEWTRLQTAIFANAGTDLAGFDDAQVGMGLNYLMNNGLSDVPYAAVDPSVPLDESMRMMRAMPRLWRDCIGIRLREASPAGSPIGSANGGPLGHVCYMWFDVWPTFRLASELAPWREACWDVLVAMLEVPCRAVQIAALHGIGHSVDRLNRDAEVDQVVGAFVRGLTGDEALRVYAEAARRGDVQ
ncbi:hypothetical protein [Roseateles amylovorans]|uniref:Uncharacterized protein n=1 Tax=Roseateles amylovorans TaxID=2978473 RepID=A0ABY6AWR0_9BURK|nr:hypothetical protein [Roseateles amylovorans]UXH76753.1 hypothetical protein N4261_17145 [Roseateles amylovorans]